MTTITGNVQGFIQENSGVVNINITGAPPPKELPPLPYEPAMILIAAGPFVMGCDGGKPEESPRHEVNLPAYRIGQYPVTSEQFAEFVRQTGRVMPELGWPGQSPAEATLHLPVTGVSWTHALAYCEWLSQQTGRPYALPNEAEWERAARYTDGRLYPWGNAWLEGRANADPDHITAVNAYPPQTVEGCYDMVGNAREWTCSLWGLQRRAPDALYSYPWIADPRRHEITANNQIRRIYRGGASRAPAQMTCATRQANMPDTKIDMARHGFRVVLEYS